MNDEMKTITSKFSFAAILIGDFLQGALFVALNGPILFVFTSKVPTGLLDAYRETILKAAALPSKSESQLLWITIFLVICLAIAEVLNPVAKVVGIIMGWFLKHQGQLGFSSYIYSNKTYPHYLARLMRDPVAKAHWEWELFLFYQRRSATVSFLVWVILLGWMRCTHWGSHFNLGYFIEACVAVLLFWGVLLTFMKASKVMWLTHEEYADLPDLPHRRSNEAKLQILISGEELSELKRHSYQMAKAYGLDRRIQEYQGKSPILLHRWDLDCIIHVIEMVLVEPQDYPDKNTSGYKSLKSLCQRLKDEYQKIYY